MGCVRDLLERRVPPVATTSTSVLLIRFLLVLPFTWRLELNGVVVMTVDHRLDA